MVGGGDQKGIGAVNTAWGIQKGTHGTEASFRPGLLLIEDSLPEGTRGFAKFTLGNTKEIKEGILIQL